MTTRTCQNLQAGKGGGVMKHLKIADYEITMPNRDWKQLLKRFDVSKAKQSDGGRYWINIKCICDKYRVDCDGCPFKVAEIWTKVGCITIAHEIIGEPTIAMYRDVITWRNRDDTQAREEIQKIRDWLLSAEDVKR